MMYQRNATTKNERMDALTRENDIEVDWTRLELHCRGLVWRVGLAQAPSLSAVSLIRLPLALPTQHP